MRAPARHRGACGPRAPWLIATALASAAATAAGEASPNLTQVLGQVALALRHDLTPEQIGLAEKWLEQATQEVESVVEDLRRSDEEEKRRLRELLDWFQEAGGQVHPSLHLQLNATTGRGWYAREPLASDTALMIIPETILLRPKSNLSNLSQATRLAIEVTQELQLGTDSFWYPYLHSLPPVSNWGSVLQWPWRFLSLLDPSPVAAEEALQARKGLLLSYILAYPHVGCSWQDWKYVMTVVRSRQNAGSDGHAYLAPAWDMVNTDAASRTVLVPAEDSDALLWKSNFPIDAGQAVTTTYALHRPLRHYLLYQGFVPDVPIAIASVSTLGGDDEMIPQWTSRLQQAQKDGVSLEAAVWDIELDSESEATDSCVADANEKSCTFSTVRVPQGLVNYCAYLWEDLEHLSDLRGQATMESPRTKELLLHVLQTSLKELKRVTGFVLDGEDLHLNLLVATFLQAEARVLEEAAAQVQSGRATVSA